MFVYEDECRQAGKDPRKVREIAEAISRAAKRAARMGITVFGGSSGELRFSDDPAKGALKLASLDGCFDGGDGADCDWGDGFRRGE